ncbi:hypothetical protein JRQ81_000583, partial [Phrynocephalus forsythii]
HCISACLSKCAPWHAKLPIQIPCQQYLTNIFNFKWRNTFTALRCRSMSSVVIEGRYQQEPMEERFCPCGSTAVEGLTHYLFGCSIYEDQRAALLQELGPTS